MLSTKNTLASSVIKLIYTKQDSLLNKKWLTHPLTSNELATEYSCQI